MEFLPLEIENIINDYKNQFERIDNIEKQYDNFTNNFEEYIDCIIVDTLATYTDDYEIILDDVFLFVNTVMSYTKQKAIEDDITMILKNNVYIKTTMDENNIFGLTIRITDAIEMNEDVGAEMLQHVQEQIYNKLDFPAAQTLMAVFERDIHNSDILDFFGYMSFDCEYLHENFEEEDSDCDYKEYYEAQF